MQTIPIKLLLICPVCGRQHVDYGVWAARIHTSHLCEHCGIIWKPCLMPTVGVMALCNHDWIERRWHVDGEVRRARFCTACSDRHPDDRLEPIKPSILDDAPRPPPGAIFLGKVDPLCGDVARDHHDGVPCTDEARGDGLAINAALCTAKPPDCYGSGQVHHASMAAENDCKGCPFLSGCSAASPLGRSRFQMAAHRNPPRNPAENSAGTPGMAPEARPEIG